MLLNRSSLSAAPSFVGSELHAKAETAMLQELIRWAEVPLPLRG